MGVNEKKRTSKAIESIDHQGNKFVSMTEMCECWGVNVSTFRNRIKHGYTLEQALTGKGIRTNTSLNVTDHLGNKFNSIAEMCKYHNVPIQTFYHKFRQGKTFKQALSKEHENKVQDHLGNTYNSVEEMCKHYNISMNTFRNRLKAGMGLEEVLTTPIEKGCYDHLGNKYISKNAMCEHYGINSGLLAYRMNSGMSLAEALTTPKSTHGIKIRDHLGNKFESKKELCDFHGINYAKFKSRMNLGYTIKEAIEGRPTQFEEKERQLEKKRQTRSAVLKREKAKNSIIDTLGSSVIDTSKTKSRRGVYEDHLGNKFHSVQEMCGYYGISITRFRSRMEKGWSLEEALTLK